MNNEQSKEIALQIFGFDFDLDQYLRGINGAGDRRRMALREKYFEIEKIECAQAVKIYYLGQLASKIKSESPDNDYKKWLDENLKNTTDKTQQNYRNFYIYISERFGSPKIFLENRKLTINPFYKLIKEKYKDAENLHKEVVERVKSNSNVKSEDLNCLIKKWDEEQGKLKQLNSEIESLEGEGYYKSRNQEEAEKRIRVSILQRRGQPKFREDLLKAYDSKCAITGCEAQYALEAAHIIPYSETKNNYLSNGLLLRADLHVLFDLNLIAIDPYEDPDKRKVRIDPSLYNTQYGKLEGTPLRKPKDEADLPKKEFLEERCKQCWWYRLPPDLS